MHTALKTWAHPQFSLNECLLAGYYRYVFGRKLPLADRLQAKIALLERSWGREDIPIERAAWEARYATVEADVAAGFDEHARYEVIAGYIHLLKPAGSILDVGCGRGLLLEALNFAGCSSYTGIDISQTAIDQAGCKTKAACFAQADAETYVPESQFDVIVFNEVLYYLDEPLRQVQRYEAYLNRGGIFITSLLEQSVRAVAISRWLKRHYLSNLALKLSSRSKSWMIDVVEPRNSPRTDTTAQSVQP